MQSNHPHKVSTPSVTQSPIQSSVQDDVGWVQEKPANISNKLQSINLDSQKLVKDTNFIDPLHMNEMQKSKTELPLYDREWQDEHWEYFANFFNHAICISEVKKKCHNARTEKLALLVMRAESRGYEIDPQRKKDWLVSGESQRGRMPIVSVCKGNYIRISSKVTERFGIRLACGDSYEISENVIEGKHCLVLIPLHNTDKL